MARDATGASDRTIKVTGTSAHQLRSSDRNGGMTPDAPGQPPHDAVGAYLLDALPEAERRTFERHLASCEACQQEARDLAPVVGLLPRLFELDGDAAAWGDDDEEDAFSSRAEMEPLPAPSSGLRDRILLAARAEKDEESDSRSGGTGSGGASSPLAARGRAGVSPSRGSGAASGPKEQDGPDAAVVPPPVPIRPRGRIRPGLAAPRDDASATPATAHPRREPQAESPVDPAVAPLGFPRWEAISRLGYDRLAAGLLALVAVGTLLWALGLQSRLDDRGEEIRALREQVEQQQNQLAQVQGRPDITMLNVSATQDGPPTARGTLFYAPGSTQGALAVTGLPAPPDGKVYQLWYLGGGRPAPEPGSTFTVDAQGNGLLALTQQLAPFQQVGVTIEPQGGSQTPTLPVVAVGANG